MWRVVGHLGTQIGARDFREKEGAQEILDYVLVGAARLDVVDNLVEELP
jgi:hypothetical protein